MKLKGEVVLICVIIGFVAMMIFLIPPARNFLFHHGAADSGGVPSPAIGAAAPIVEEPPRNDLPMGQYTVPSIFKKMRYVVQDKDGGRRGVYYYWYGPRGIPAGTKLPLVIVLHDAAGADFGAIYLRSTSVQKEFPSFLLIPQSPAGKVWSWPKRFSGQEFPPPQLPPVLPEGVTGQSLPDAVQLAMRLVQAVPVDENRIYIIGCDDGATGVYGALANYPGLFAAGVEAGGIWSFLDAAKIAKTPLLLLLQSLGDAAASPESTRNPEFTRNMDQIVKGAGGKVYLGEFKTSAHDCESPNYYSHAVWQWLFSQRHAPAAPPAQVVSTPGAATPVAQ